MTMDQVFKKLKDRSLMTSKFLWWTTTEEHEAIKNNLLYMVRVLPEKETVEIDNCKDIENYWSFFVNYNPDDAATYFYFEKEEDAVMFRLRTI
jgi:hypothetical protein